MDGRKHAIELVRLGASVTDSAYLSGVSRQCLHKWLKREDAGEDLTDRSRAPKRHAFAVSTATRKRLIRLKKRYPDEGPRKLRTYFIEDYPDERPPAASTIGRILKDAGLTTPRPNRRRTEGIRTKSTLTEATQANDVWCIDYKGEFSVDGEQCYPLTLTDLYSCYTLAVCSHHGACTQPSMRTLWGVFGRYGLPRVIRCDNGTPFVSTKAPAGLTRLAVMLARLKIERERIDPGRPDQNGRHERFHRSLKGATANPPAPSWVAQQRRFDRYRTHFNHRRPHEALGMKPPATAYCTSPRLRPQKLPPIEHPTAQRILKVYSSGEITIRGSKLFLSSTLAGETVAANEIADDVLQISFGPIYLGVYSFREKRPCFIQAP